jgi:hypothetical protein
MARLVDATAGLFLFTPFMIVTGDRVDRTGFRAQIVGRD